MFFQVFSPDIVHTASFGGDRCKAVGPGGLGSNRLCLLQALVSHHRGNPSGAIKLYLHTGVLLVSLRMEVSRWSGTSVITDGGLSTTRTVYYIH